MFDLLLESRPVGRVRPWSGGVVALAAHAAIIFSIARVVQPTPPVVSIFLDTLPLYSGPRPTPPPAPPRPPCPPPQARRPHRFPPGPRCRSATHWAPSSHSNHFPRSSRQSI